MSSVAPDLNPITPAKITEAINTAGISIDGRVALRDWGFTDAMTLAFLNTAQDTNSIVSSRVPGAACTDLIEQGHDLKGFQIKCKSCDWGPMAGFLCQLPFFNKAGYKNIDFNTGYIADYLEGIERFDGIKLRIEKINKAIENIRSPLLNAGPIYGAFIAEWDVITARTTFVRKLSQLVAQGDANNDRKLTPSELDEIGTALSFEKIQKFLAAGDDNPLAVRRLIDENPPVVITSLRSYVVDRALAPFNRAIAAEIKQYKDAEQQAGKWSGENTLAGKSPFVQLKRRFSNAQGGEAAPQQVADQLASVRCQAAVGNDAAGAALIWGTAFDKLPASKVVNEMAATIKVDFLLRQDRDTLIWQLYHRNINFRASANLAWTPYTAFGANDAATLRAMGIDPVEYPSLGLLNSIFMRDASEGAVVQHGGNTYYPLCGIMNPHPPYKGAADLHRNAVSGDYDLFAFWPSVELPKSDTTRAAEIYLNQPLKVAYPNPLFCVDFIPGFREIDKKESPEAGNYNYLGQLAAMLLNSHTNALARKLNDGNALVVPNKAFHSDEGGRPGVLEIEFPIAVFFPATIQTTALTGGSATRGGLVTDMPKLMQLLLDINYAASAAGVVDKPKEKQFRIILHSEWMMHLFFLTLPDVEQPGGEQSQIVQSTWPGIDALQALEKKDSAGTGNELPEEDALLEKRRVALGKRGKEFRNLRKVIEGENPGDRVRRREDHIQKLRALLGSETAGRLEPLDLATFGLLQKAFLGFAFEGDKKALVKRMAIEQIVYKSYIDKPL